MKCFSFFYLSAVACYALLSFVALFVTVRKDYVYKRLRTIWIGLTLLLTVSSVGIAVSILTQ